MEKETKVTEKSADWLLRGIIGAVVVLCTAIIFGVQGKGSNQNFAGRTKYIAILILRSLGRPFSSTNEKVAGSKRKLELAYNFLMELYSEVYEGGQPQRRESDKK